jgi:glycosyltransferase involved in cell wall biosynthesis
VLAARDVFVLSSVSEGMSNTILEAMASRLGVLVTKVGGAELVVDGTTGLLVPGPPPQAIASALERLARQPALRAGGAATWGAWACAAVAIDWLLRNYGGLFGPRPWLGNVSL